MIKKKEYYYSFIIFLTLVSVLYSLLTADYEAKEREYLTHNLQDTKKEFSLAKDLLGKIADTTFKLVIDKPEILKLFAQKKREALYKRLLPTYRYLRKVGVRQLHFHLPGTISFLRFHRPQKYGDDLTGIRFSIEEAQLKKKEIHCFEEGRIFNGFRNVYPLWYKHRFIGTVEISFSPRAIAQILHRYNKDSFYGLLLKKNIVQTKVFKGEKKNYIEIAKTGFVWDRSFYNEEKKYLQSSLEKELPKLFSMLDNRSRYILINKKYVMNAIAIKNCKKRLVGFLIVVEPVEFLEKLHRTYLIYLVLSFIASFVISLIFFFYFKHQGSFQQKLYEMSVIDPLTKLSNRRALHNYVNEYLQKNAQFSVIFCDIDHFKKLNDTYGHDFGDKVLTTVAKTLKKNLRSSDFVARWGGEEFVIILQNQNLSLAKKLAERLRKAIQSLQSELGIEVTCSFGVAQRSGEESVEETIKRADEALYRAKKRGRNRVEAI